MPAVTLAPGSIALLTPCMVDDNDLTSLWLRCSWLDSFVDLVRLRDLDITAIAACMNPSKAQMQERWAPFRLFEQHPVGDRSRWSRTC